MPNSENTESAIEYMEERFGVNQEDLEGLQLKEISGDIWLCSEEESGYETETKGIRAVRVMDIGLKPTTYLLQLLQDEISKNKVAVSEEEFRDLLNGQMIERELDEKGYVAIEFDGRVIGCCFYMDNLISSRIPEGRGSELLGALDDKKED
ncbi:hypothetical protein [Candidatus Nanohalovita haloferacivicina]|uniref:hypothetical protein n=1 Tax=Candidatus Nanohalovita haloferacivicina TaxID=2978046 RepID=UPI00325FA6BB